MKRLGVLALLAFTLAVAAAQAATARPTFKLMTRNLYIGTDLSAVITAPSPAALLGVVSTGYANVLASNYAERAQAVAGEIARARPDVVGLQEVIMIRTQTPSDGQATPAQDVQLDFLQLIRDALRARSLDYVVAVSRVSGDDELPSASGFDVRVTDREVLLVRRGRNAPRILRRRSGAFVNVFEIGTQIGVLIRFRRAWVAADLSFRGRTVRVVNTHLEAFASSIQALQGRELLRGPARTTLPVVMLGDFNSPADGTGSRTYADLRRGGFRDAWASMHPREPGYTCCHAADLRSERAFDERIDLVLFKGRLTARAATIVGEEPDDRTPSGLWPSDHAGVVATLAFR